MIFLLLTASFVFTFAYTDYPYRNEGNGRCCFYASNHGATCHGAEPKYKVKVTSGVNSCRVQCNHEDQCLGFNWLNIADGRCVMWMEGPLKGSGPQTAIFDTTNTECFIKMPASHGWGQCSIQGIYIQQVKQLMPYTWAGPFTNFDADACRDLCVNPLTNSRPDGRQCGGYQYSGYQDICILWLAHPQQLRGPSDPGYVSDWQEYPANSAINWHPSNMQQYQCRIRPGYMYHSQPVYDTSACNNHGNVQGFSEWGPPACSCYSGWSGDTCEIPSACDASDCSGNSIEVSGSRPNCQCTCAEDWGGSDCSIEQCDASDCSNQGTASGLRPDCTCDCAEDWMGSDCSEPKCKNRDGTGKTGGSSCGGVYFLELGGDVCCPSHLSCMKKCDWHSECLDHCPEGWDCNITPPEDCDNGPTDVCRGTNAVDTCCGEGLECTGGESYAICQDPLCPHQIPGSPCDGSNYEEELCCPAGTSCFRNMEWQGGFMSVCAAECDESWPCADEPAPAPQIPVPVAPFGLPSAWTCVKLRKGLDFTWDESYAPHSGYFSYTAPLLTAPARLVFIHNVLGAYPFTSFGGGVEFVDCPEGDCVIKELGEWMTTNYENPAPFWLTMNNCDAVPECHYPSMENEVDVYFCYQP